MKEKLFFAFVILYQLTYSQMGCYILPPPANNKLMSIQNNLCPKLSQVCSIAKAWETCDD